MIMTGHSESFKGKDIMCCKVLKQPHKTEVCCKHPLAGAHAIYGSI